MDSVRAVLLAMPDVEAKVLAAEHLRGCGYRGVITAVNAFPEECAKIEAAGADWTHNFYDGAGSGLAERTMLLLESAAGQDAPTADDANGTGLRHA